MKKNLRNNCALYMVIALLTFASCGQGVDHAEHAETYTCPMHPTVVSDRSGTCPICGMDLVPKARAGEEVEITEELSKLLKSPNEAIVASVRTIKGQYKSVPVSVPAHGVVTYDTRNIYTIPARVGGRLEKIYLKYAFQHVSKGEKIAEVYSPELITAERELLYLLENDSENVTMIKGAKIKLELLGLSNRQINDLIQKNETSNIFNVYSPYSGYLITNSQAAPSTSREIGSSQSAGGGMGDDMGATSSSNITPTTAMPSRPGGSILREGNYVTTGQTLFTVVNSSALRIELDLAGVYSGAVKEGSKVQLSFGDGKDLTASVDFVQPFFTEGQDFLKIRVYTNKTESLHIGHLVNAMISLAPTEALWVPREAVLDLGAQKVVFIKDRGVLKPKQVTTGVTTDGMIEIKNGLASSEEIAANAQYLVDSESFIKPVK